MEHELVVDEYRPIDADKRLALFLYCRDFREEFVLIEERISNGLIPLRYQSWLNRLIPVLEISCPLGPSDLSSREQDLEKPQIGHGVTK